MAQRKKRPTPTGSPARTNPADLRERLLADFATLKVPLTATQLDAVLARADRDGLTHLEFTQLLVAAQAQQRRERGIARRINAAKFDELHTLADFDWEFNAKAINRTQIEELATCDFIRRRDNLIVVGQPGVGKSRIVKAIGQTACVLGYHVRYTTSAKLLVDLTKSLADHSLPKRVRYWARFDWLIIDEFAFDKVERSENPQAANLLYKVIDDRRQRSTTVVTNVDVDSLGAYLEDRWLAPAFLDRVVDRAIVLKINGKSYRAHRAHTKTNPSAQ